ncbi:hypothetical protein, partial [Streptomyces venezuelae]|uniref:hypothetical protein n=1 Tax=Streptomyces venezuelae TaxID=54571 RepID=UPI001F1F95B0
AARAVAEVIRRCFAGTEQRSYPVPGGGTRLHLTVDTETAAGPARTWLATSRPATGTGPHPEEPLTAAALSASAGRTPRRARGPG